MSQVLRNVYGEEYSFRLNQDSFRGLKPEEVNLRTLFPAMTKILSGHLPFPFLKDIIGEDNPRLFTWLRDPVERVISNYYWRVNLDRALKDDQGLEMSRDMTMEEYIHIPKNQNRMSTFLEGLRLQDLFFLGLMETYDRDLEALALKLGWNKLPRIHTNINPTFKKEPRHVSSAMRKEIESLNGLDIALYQDALLLQSSINQTGGS